MKLLDKIFRKKEKKMSWDDVSLSQYIAISKIEKDSDTAFYDIVEILFGEKMLEMPLDKFREAMKARAKDLEFLQTEVPQHMPKKEYIINGHKYGLDLKKLKTSQYIDYTNLMKNANFPDDYARLISIFLLSEDDDFDQTVEDVKNMPITDVLSICFFFNAALAAFLQCFRYYSEEKIKKLKIPKTEKAEMIAAMEKDFNSALSR